MPRGIACSDVRASRALEKAAVKAFIVRGGPVKDANEEHVRKNILAADVRFQTRPACDLVYAEVTGSTPAPVGTRGSGAKCRSVLIFGLYDVGWTEINPCLRRASYLSWLGHVKISKPNLCALPRGAVRRSF